MTDICQFWCRPGRGLSPNEFTGANGVGYVSVGPVLHQRGPTGECRLPTQSGHSRCSLSVSLDPEGRMRRDLRRRFLLASGALLASRGAVAQTRSTGNPFRIGLFPNLNEPFLSWMHEALGAAGWQKGRNYVFVPSNAEYGQPTAPGAQQLIDQKVDLVLVYSTSHAVAMQQVTSTVPIVMWTSGYPVEAGVAASLARPGKNVTGMTMYAGTGIWGKLLELLRDSKPTIKRIGVAWGYVPPTFPREEIEPCYRELRQAAQALNVALHIQEIAKPDGVQAGLASIDAARPDALLITAGPGFYTERHRVIQFAVSKRIPTAADWQWPPSEETQPLLVYAPSFAAAMRQSASYIVRILDGRARPGDLPIQQPSKFELMVDLKTAKAIGLTIPQSLLLRADRVIE
jgi:putative ABC transport system substrate-binding protein